MDGFDSYALFLCLSEDRFLVGGIESFADPNNDDRERCRFCGGEASEFLGEVSIAKEYGTWTHGAPRFNDPELGH